MPSLRASWRTISTNGGTAEGLNRSAATHKERVRKEYRTLRATFGNGWQTGMTHTITRRAQTGIRRVRRRGPERSFAVPVGNRKRPFSAQPIASTAIHITGITAFASLAQPTPQPCTYGKH